MNLCFLNKSLSIICFIIVVFGLISGFAQAKEDEVFDPFSGGGGGLSEPNNWVTKGETAEETARNDGPAIPEIQFQGDPITMAFQMISDVSGWSIFTTNTVDKAKVTLWAKNISARELLDIVVALSGFTYHQKGNVISVMTYDEYLQNYGLVREIITLKYADSDSVSAAVTKLISKVGKVVVHKNTNTIILYEVKANLDYILDVIYRLDIPGQETVSEIIQLKHISSDNITKTLQGIFVSKAAKEKNKSDVKPKDTSLPKETVTKSDSYSIVVSGNEIGIYSAPEGNLLIIVGSQRDINEAKKVITLLDVASEETLTETVEMQYCDAKLVAGILEKIFSGKVENPNNKSGKTSSSTSSGDIGFYAVPNSNRLIISGLKDKIQEAKSLIGEIDIDSEIPPIKIIGLKYTDAKLMADTLKEIFSYKGENTTNKSESGTDSKIGFHVVPESNRLIVVGSNKNITEVEELIEKIDISIEMSIIEIIDVQYTDAEKMAEILKEIFSRKDKDSIQQLGYGQFEGMGNPLGFGISTIGPSVGPIRSGASPVGTGVNPTGLGVNGVIPGVNSAVSTVNEIGLHVIPDSNRIIVVGTQNGVDQVKDLISKIDISTEMSLIEIIELQYTDVELMASTLKEIFSSKDKSPANKSGESSRDEIGLYVIPDSNRMIIAGTKKDIDEVKDLISKIDISTEMSLIEIIELQYTDVELMASTLKEIFSSKDKSPANKSGESSRDEIGLYVIPDSNRMIIAGTKKDIDEVKDLISKIDISTEMSLIEIIELQYTDVELMASTLKEIFSSKDKSPANKSGESSRDEIGLYVIPDSNRMIIAGTKKDIDEVKDLISKIDISTEMSLIEIIELQYTDVELMASTLKEIFSSKDKSPANKSGESSRDEIGLYVIPDSNRMIIAGTKKDIDEVKDLISKIDISTEMSLIEIIELQYTDVKLMASTLKEIFSSKDNSPANKSGESSRDEIGLYVIPDSNRMIIAGTKKDIDEVKDLISKIDISTEMSLIEIINLKNSNPELMVKTLKEVFSFKKADDPKGKAQVDEIGLCAVPYSKRLIVAGTQRDVNRVKELVAEIDVDNEMSLTEIVECKYTDAKQMADILEKVFSDKNKYSGESQIYEIGLYAIPESNRLIIAGMQQDIDEAKRVISEVDIDTEVLLLDIIELKYADCESLVSTLREIFPNKDKRSIGKEKNPNPNPKEVGSGDFAADFGEALDFFAMGRTNRIVVRGLKRDVTRVLEFIKRLDIYADSTSKTYHVAYVNAADVITSLQQVLGVVVNGKSSSSVVMTLLEDNNSILLTGPPSAHRITESLLKSIDIQGEYESGIIKMYKLDNSDAAQVATVIKELIGQDEQDGVGNKKSEVSTEQIFGEPESGGEGLSKLNEYSNRIETRVTTNTATNSIIVQATANRHRELEKLIKVLDARKKQVMIKAMIGRGCNYG